jgi:hypothetical protein
MSPKQAQVLRWSRHFKIFLFCAILLLVFGRSFIPKPLFVVLLVVFGTAFALMWIWAAYVVPPAVTEKIRELNCHPDANVRALQKEEITIEEYLRRRADAPHSLTTPSTPASGQSDTHAAR